MAVKVRERDGAWWLFIDHKSKRKARRVGVGKAGRKAAELAAIKIAARLAEGGPLTPEPAAVAAPAVPAPEFPHLRDVLPTWLDRKERSGDIRGSTPKGYKSRLSAWVYPHALQDGRLLGDVPIDEVTREMLGAVILRVKEAGRSLAIIEGIRNPLRGFYAEQIETKVLPGPNPAADLKFFIGKRADKRRLRSLKFFLQEEGPQLAATSKALSQRWHAFILTGLIGGLRWGESAALHRSDIDWRRGRLHVHRSFSEKANAILPCKDSEARWVKASPALLEALRAQIDAVDLEGLTKGWNAGQCQLVFPTPSGKIIRHSHFLEHVWQPLMSKAGLPYRKYHSTRHTYATWLLEDDADLRWVQGQMGHASIEQTAGTYGHSQPERHEAAVEGLDRYLTV